MSKSLPQFISQRPQTENGLHISYKK